MCLAREQWTQTQVCFPRLCSGKHSKLLPGTSIKGSQARNGVQRIMHDTHSAAFRM